MRNCSGVTLIRVPIGNGTLGSKYLVMSMGLASAVRARMVKMRMRVFIVDLRGSEFFKFDL